MPAGRAGSVDATASAPPTCAIRERERRSSGQSDSSWRFSAEVAGRTVRAGRRNAVDRDAAHRERGFDRLRRGARQRERAAVRSVVPAMALTSAPARLRSPTRRRAVRSPPRRPAACCSRNVAKSSSTYHEPIWICSRATLRAALAFGVAWSPSLVLALASRSLRRLAARCDERLPRLDHLLPEQRDARGSSGGGGAADRRAAVPDRRVAGPLRRAGAPMYASRRADRDRARQQRAALPVVVAGSCTRKQRQLLFARRERRLVPAIGCLHPAPPVASVTNAYSSRRRIGRWPRRPCAAAGGAARTSRCSCAPASTRDRQARQPADQARGDEVEALVRRLIELQRLRVAAIGAERIGASERRAARAGCADAPRGRACSAPASSSARTSVASAARAASRRPGPRHVSGRATSSPSRAGSRRAARLKLLHEAVGGEAQDRRAAASRGARRRSRRGRARATAATARSTERGCVAWLTRCSPRPACTTR